MPIDSACYSYMIPFGGNKDVKDVILEILVEMLFPEHERKYNHSQIRLTNHGIDACLSHALWMKQTFDFNKTKILEISKKNNVRTDLEAMHIQLNTLVSL